MTGIVVLVRNWKETAPIALLANGVVHSEAEAGGFL